MRKLEDDGLVRAVEESGQKRYFAGEFRREDREMAAVIRNAPFRRILLALLSLGELKHGDLAGVAEIGPSTLSYHIGRLLRKGIVAVRTEGKFRIYSLCDRASVERAVLRHGHSVGDEALDAYVTIWTQWRRPRERSGEGIEGRSAPAPKS